jgi:hypothetical protein
MSPVSTRPPPGPVGAGIPAAGRNRGLLGYRAERGSRSAPPSGPVSRTTSFVIHAATLAPAGIDFDADGVPAPRFGTAPLTDEQRNFTLVAALAVLDLPT